jgi:hypothetical protein
MGVDSDKLEGAAWIVYARNRGNQSAIDVVEKNASNYTPEEIIQINKRAAEIAIQVASNK